MNGPNWGKLVMQGRAKAVGMPWNDDEVKAIHEYKIPVDYVRRGCLTPEKYNEVQEGDLKQELETGKKPLEALNRKEVVKEAKDKGVQFDETAANTNDLVQQIKTAPELPKYEDMKMGNLLKLAKEKGYTFKFGTKKVEIINKLNS